MDALFQLGMAQMNQRDAEAAIDTFSRIIQRKPDFAEGWNKRATLYYLIGEYDKSLADSLRGSLRLRYDLPPAP
ncbi:MAG: tetratricopeptide repeat protein [candidate division NC10 bacterium]|nr:tetratricopeptide repeat protein [candidate division NC10 bacterium]